MDDLWVGIRSAYFYVYNSALQIDENNCCDGLNFRIFTLFSVFRLPVFPKRKFVFPFVLFLSFFFVPMDNRLILWLLTKHLLLQRNLNYRPKLRYSARIS